MMEDEKIRKKALDCARTGQHPGWQEVERALGVKLTMIGLRAEVDRECRKARQGETDT
jgi:hypothetical protein